MAEEKKKKRWFEATQDIDKVLALVGCKLEKGARVLIFPHLVKDNPLFKRVEHGNTRGEKKKAYATKRAKDRAAAEAAKVAAEKKAAAENKDGGGE